MAKELLVNDRYLQDPNPPKKVMVRKIKNDTKLKVFLASFNFRDRVIARVLYYSDMNLAKILRLRIRDIPEIFLPETVMADVLFLCEGREENEFIFINLRGCKVQHTHIYQAFRRASDRVDFTISPTDLQQDVQEVVLNCEN